MSLLMTTTDDHRGDIKAETAVDQTDAVGDPGFAGIETNAEADAIAIC